MKYEVKKYWVVDQHPTKGFVVMSGPFKTYQDAENKMQWSDHDRVDLYIASTVETFVDEN